MANKILHKRSSTATNIPLAGSLDYGELAINYADEKLYIKNSSDAVVEVGGGSQATYYNATSTSNLTIGTVATTSAAVLDFGTITIPTNGLMSATGIVSRIGGAALPMTLRYGLLVNGVVHELGRYSDDGVWESVNYSVTGSTNDEQEGMFGTDSAATRNNAMTVDIANSGIATGSQNAKLVIWATDNACTLQGATKTSRATLAVVDLT